MKEWHLCGLKWYKFYNKVCENRGNLGKIEYSDSKQIPSYLESLISLPWYGDWIQSPIYQHNEYFNVPQVLIY
jgi:hypothetical protein